MLRVGPWAVVGTDAGGLGHPGQHHRPRGVRVEQIVGPVAAGGAVARHQDHGGAARRRGTPGRASGRRCRPARRSRRSPGPAQPPGVADWARTGSRQRQHQDVSAIGRRDDMEAFLCPYQTSSLVSWHRLPRSGRERPRLPVAMRQAGRARVQWRRLVRSVRHRALFTPRSRRSGHTRCPGCARPPPPAESLRSPTPVDPGGCRGRSRWPR